MCCERWRIRLLPGAHHATARIRTAGNLPDSRSRAGAKCCNPALRYRRAFRHQQCALGRPDICECMDVDSRVATDAHGTSMRRCADRRSCGSFAGASNGHPSSQDRGAGKPNGYEGGCGGATATKKSTLVIAFSRADRRRKIVRVQIPDHCGNGHRLTVGNVRIDQRVALMAVPAMW